MAQSQHLRLNFIDGRWVPAESGLTRENINPADVADRIGEFAVCAAAAGRNGRGCRRGATCSRR
ncbi:hypothetical protein ACLB9X_30740 [Streptomyces sp. 5K101]|uniref:hypothetical protein n=1 Tax=Streptomyces sp. 5K101 TaxID=3390037 RepID=UPI003974CF93